VINADGIIFGAFNGSKERMVIRLFFWNNPGIIVSTFTTIDTMR